MLLKPTAFKHFFVGFVKKSYVKTTSLSRETIQEIIFFLQFYKHKNIPVRPPKTL